MHVLDSENELRLAHFKKPEDGPWFIPKCPRCKEKMFVGTTPVRDRSLAALAADDTPDLPQTPQMFGRKQGKTVSLVDAAPPKTPIHRTKVEPSNPKR
jgi:hypothetical protein